jgi:O-methyltransferase involved in polyketide biosynthesis
VPYLTRADVSATVAVVAGLSAPGSRLIVNYQTPAMSASAGRMVARAMTGLARRPSPWHSEPRRSAWTPATMGALLAEHGFAVEQDDDLGTIAGRLDVPVRQRRSLRDGRVAIAIRGG